MLKPGYFRDPFQGIVGFEQQLLDFRDLDPPDFSLGGATQVFSEFLFQLTARCIGVFYNLIYSNA